MAEIPRRNMIPFKSQAWQHCQWALSALCLLIFLGCPGDAPPIHDASKTTLVETQSTGKRAAASTPTKLAMMVTPEELSAIETQIMAQVTALSNQSCERPGLGGKTTAGTGTAALGAALRAEGYPECRAELETKAQALKHAVFGPSRDSVVSTNAPDDTALYPLEDLTTPVDPTLVKLVKACEPALRDLADAIQHERVCSPWRPGLTPPPENQKVIMLLANAASLNMRVLWQAGEVDKALELGLVLIRATQDLGRGGPTLVEAMTGHAASIGPIATLRAILNAKKSISAPALSILERGLESLRKTEPDFHQILRGDQLQIQLYYMLPGLKDASWAPPGGWGSYPKPPTKLPPQGTYLTGNPEQERAVTVAASVQISNEIIASCPAQSTIEQCAKSMTAAAAKAKSDSAALKTTQSTLWKRAMGGQDLQLIREQITTVMKGIAMPSFERYIKRFASRHFTVAALAAHVDARKRWQRHHTCVSAQTLSDELAERLKDPTNNKSMKLTKNDHQLTLESTMALSIDGKKPLRYMITCPNPTQPTP